MTRCYEDFDLAYLAGIIDGEGSITINRTWAKYKNGDRIPHYDVKLQIASSSPILAEEMKKKYGGFTYTQLDRRGYRPMHHWILSEGNAISLLQKCFKFSRLKAFHIMQVIAYHFDRTLCKGGGYNGYYKTNHKEIQKRTRYWEIMRKFAVKGVNRP